MNIFPLSVLLDEKYWILVYLLICCANRNVGDNNLKPNAKIVTPNNNNTIVTNQQTNELKSNLVSTESGSVPATLQKNDTTHQGREGLTESSFSSKQTKIVNNGSSSSVNSQTSDIGSHNIGSTSQNPFNFEIGQKNDGKTSVRKNLPEYHETIETVSTPNSTVIAKTDVKTTPQTIKERPKKPMFTESSYDEPKKEEGLSRHHNNIAGIEMVEEEKSHRSADYVLPIVAVILSVPLVAIIISVLYKRTSEWWHHRHYRRMDFLIEGMYNN